MLLSPHSPPLLRGSCSTGGRNTVSPVICQIPSSAKGFYPMFVVPKKDGGERSVINLKYLNKHKKSEHFKMEGILTVKALLKRDDFMAKVDLKGRFLCGSISTTSFLQYGREDLTVQLFPLGIKSIHIDTQASHEDGDITEHSTDGWYAFIGRVQTEANRTHLVEIVSPMGFIANSKKSILAGYQVSGDDCELHIYGTEVARRENQENLANCLLSLLPSYSPSY